MKSRILMSMAFAAGLAVLDVGAATEVSSVADLYAAFISPSDGEEIVLAPGTYTLAAKLSVVSAHGVTLRSSGGRDRTIIEGDSTFRLLEVSGENFTVRGITFRNGKASQGGAIKVSSAASVASVKIVDCDFEDCQAKYGGAIDAVNENYTSFVTRGQYGLVSGCKFKNCVATNTDMWCGGGAINGALWIEDSTFDGCRSNDARQGHAVIAVSGCTTITNCVFVNHTSTAKGLVGTGRDALNHAYPNGTARVVDCLIANSTFAGSSDAFFESKVLLDRCVISNFSSTVSSSLPRLYSSPSSDASEARVTSCLFVDNQCPFRMDSIPSLLNCTFVRNVGGLACDYLQTGQTLNLFITNCVFWANVAKTDWPYGATYKGVPGIYWHPSTPLQDLIKIGNTVVEGGTDNADVAAVLAADATGESSRLTALTAQKGPGFKNMATGDWSLKKASVLVDGGVLYDGIATARDLAGHPRCLRFGAVDPAALPDIGCYEFYSIPGLTIRLR